MAAGNAGGKINWPTKVSLWRGRAREYWQVARSSQGLSTLDKEVFYDPGRQSKQGNKDIVGANEPKFKNIADFQCWNYYSKQTFYPTDIY